MAFTLPWAAILIASASVVPGGIRHYDVFHEQGKKESIVDAMKNENL